MLGVSIFADFNCKKINNRIIFSIGIFFNFNYIATLVSMKQFLVVLYDNIHLTRNSQHIHEYFIYE